MNTGMCATCELRSITGENATIQDYCRACGTPPPVACARFKCEALFHLTRLRVEVA